MNIRDRYCQSCGMPLDINEKEYLGTNEDKTKNNEFCFSCLIDGKFSFDHPVEQLIDDWVKATDWYNQYAKTCYTPEELRIIMKKRIPALKRWKQKDETQNIHYEIINGVTVYINQHLTDQLEIKFLAEMAGLSKYHFLRTFKSVTGENPGSYINRLRLEYAAHLLITTDLSLSEISVKINYQSRHSLSKAFKKHFGIPPSDYKNLYQKNTDDKIHELQPLQDYEIKYVENTRILYLALDESCKDLKNYKNKWAKLLKFVDENNLRTSKSKFLSISLDDPAISGTENSRFLLGVTINKDLRPKDKFGIMVIPEGKYAVFKFKGDHDALRELYRNIYMKWLPQSIYRQKNTLSFEIYLNSPENTSASDLLTEVYIPVELKSE